MRMKTKDPECVSTDPVETRPSQISEMYLHVFAVTQSLEWQLSERIYSNFGGVSCKTVNLNRSYTGNEFIHL